MKVILQERVANLGNVGDTVNVKAGYARNFLLPRAKAVQATNENVVSFEARRVELEKKAADVLTEAKKRAESFADYRVTIEALSSEEGRLFGSIGPRDVAKAVNDAGLTLEKSEVEMPEGPIRMTGEHTVHLHLHSEVNAEITAIVVPASE